MNLKTKAIFTFGFMLILFFIPNILKGEAHKICLTMIVKNESKIIERCLNSVKDIVDCISICDTGSTDNTIQIIEQFLQRTKIPGKVHKHAWKNFGYNRTLSVQAAQSTLLENGIPLMQTFLLLLDADMILEVNANFDKSALREDNYLVVQKNSSQSYYNTRLVRASFPWQCVGVTHEYWSSKIPVKEAKLRTLAINDQDDGGSKSDKFERDIRLLTQGLKEEPDNTRYMFYLAQSYKSIKNYEDSIKWYKARIEKGGWNEEVWYSKFMIGQCYEDMGEWDHALFYYLDAYQFNPERSEPLQQISTYYRTKEQHNLAYLFAKQGSKISYPHQQILFISYPVYDYLFDQDLSISAYYTPFKEEGFDATNRLLLKKNIPQHIKEQAYKNMLFYVQNLQNAQYKSIKIDLPLIREGLSSHYNPMNPSIRRTARGYDLICRTVNYIQIGAKHFKSLDLLDTANTAKTRNFFIQYDPNFHILSQHEIIEQLPRERKRTYNVEGLEDCRMFEFKNSIWFTCTTLDTNPSGEPQVSLCKLADQRLTNPILVEKLIPLAGPNLTRCEKNWLPFVKDSNLYMIYSYDPFVIYKLNIENENNLMNRPMIYRYDLPKHDFSRFAGSAPPIEFDDGYLLLVHETVYDDQRNYLHRFLYLDKDLNIKKDPNPLSFYIKG